MSVAAGRVGVARRVLPTVAEVRLLPVVARSTVTEDDVDINGHMNILSYIHWSSLGVDAVLRTLGVNEHYRGVRGLTFFTSEQHVTYYTEQRLGESFSVHVRWVDSSDKVMHAIAYLVNDTDSTLASSFEVVGVHVDLESRRTAPMPIELADGLESLVERDHGLGWAPTLSGAMGVRRASRTGATLH